MDTNTQNSPQAGQPAGCAVADGSAGFSVGQEVQWVYTPRGGWCIPYRVRARVVKINRTRIRISAKRGDGALHEANVKPENLRPLPNIKDEPHGGSLKQPNNQ